MISSQTKNSIISFLLIVSTILTPLSFIPSKAEAQSIGGYTSGLGGAIMALPLCQEVASNRIKKIFNGIKGWFSSSESLNAGNLMSGGVGDLTTTGGLSDMQKKLMGLDFQTSSAMSEVDSIKVHLPDTTEKKIDDIVTNTTNTDQKVESSTNNDTCYKAIGRLIAKMLIQKLTISTINWINSGFNGSPAFIQDAGKFFGDIAKNEVLQFGLEIKDPNRFPFGKAWLQNTAAAFNNKFQDNARYSLNELISATNPDCGTTQDGKKIGCDIAFKQDFSQGGWNAWNAITQAPANNPLGFQLMADNELQRRLAGTVESTAQYTHEALQQANGFLGDMRCSADSNMKQSEIRTALIGGKEDPCKAAGGTWQYVTPGKMLADAAGIVTNHANDSYLNINDLNDAVAAIADAVLAKFSSNFMEKGFANLDDSTNIEASGALIFDNNNTDYTSQTEKDFTPEQLSSSWLSNNPDFNIRTDLTQALIDEQRTYSDKLALQNKELMSTTDGKNYTLSSDRKSSNAYGLMPAIYQLDYCKPGPHPGWENDSRRVLTALTNTIGSVTKESLSDVSKDAIGGAAQKLAPLAGAIIGATIGSAVPVVGTIIGAAVGGLVSWAIGAFSSSSDAEKVRTYYASQVFALTGMLPDFTNDHDTTTTNIMSSQGVVQGMDEIFNRYVQIMNKTYFSSADMLPTVTKEAASAYNQLAGYAQMIKNNTDKIASLKSTVNILVDIKKAVSDLNIKYPDKGTDYENELKPQINAFGRLSVNMVNGADIASADSLLKQIIDKKNYIYNNLLKGPYGCEKDLEKPQKNFPSVEDSYRDWKNYNVLSVKRMTYPFPILYDYNSLAKDEKIPDPWGNCTTNCTINKTDTTLGPGFLSFVLFSTGFVNGLVDWNDVRGPARLQMHDIFGIGTDGAYRYVPVGKGSSDQKPGPFETNIGVY